MMMVNESKAKARVTQTPFTPHLPSLSISARLFCPGNAPIKLPAEEATLSSNFIGKLGKAC